MGVGCGSSSFYILGTHHFKREFDNFLVTKRVVEGGLLHDLALPFTHMRTNVSGTGSANNIGDFLPTIGEKTDAHRPICLASYTFIPRFSDL